MAKLLTIPTNVQRVGRTFTKSGKLEYAFEVTCIKCGNIRIVKRKQHAIGMSQKPCKRCSNKNNHPIGVHGSVRLSFFNKYKTGAQTRSKNWNIGVEEANSILEKQNHKCALSGLPISACDDLNKITASLDRIDNSKGYEPDNVQWVHKSINMMRGTLSIETFKKFCKEVTNHNKEKW